MENNDGKETRRFVRHQASIPIHVGLGDLVAHKKEYLNDIGFGGLSFKCKQRVETGTPIRISIPLVRPMFEAHGKVVWCRKSGSIFNVGVEFSISAGKFKIRMLEQICHIETYKKSIRQKEGRRISGEQAAIEWISKFADKFPEDIKD